MILYVNGDSHSEGHDAGGPEFAYGKHIADALNYEYVCDAVAGCSNDSIIARTKNYLESNTPDFLIIGWSTWEREEWFYQGQSYRVSASGLDQLPKALHGKYKEYVIKQSLPEVANENEIKNHNNIINLHNNLKSKNIKHLFFNCFSCFGIHKAYGRPEYNWTENYLDPYNKDMTYYFWLEQQGYKPSNPKYYHYGVDAHRAWADFLLPKVQTLLTQNG